MNPAARWGAGEFLRGPAGTDNETATNVPPAQTQGRHSDRLPQGGAGAGTERGRVAAGPFGEGRLPRRRRLPDQGTGGRGGPVRAGLSARRLSSRRRRLVV